VPPEHSSHVTSPHGHTQVGQAEPVSEECQDEVQTSPDQVTQVEGSNLTNAQVAPILRCVVYCPVEHVEQENREVHLYLIVFEEGDVQYQPMPNLREESQAKWGAELRQAEPAALHVTFQLCRTGVRPILGTPRGIGSAGHSVGG
jgi:hypothetical protein